ncbi:MAG: LysM peptidoglycan-binding domain-containing protein [Burkholderiaceae bacterium]|nr:LysM peptidoglycan-binding domain-containing protein [Microbacteriaceae bacterium]
MTNTSGTPARPESGKDRNRFARGLLATMPIVLVGSMAMSLTGPLGTTDAPKDLDKGNATELGKTIREALAAAHAASVAEATSAAVTQVAAVAPATYKVVAGDSISGIAGRYGLATASVLALNGLGWKSVIFPGQTLTLTNAAAPKQITPAPSAAPASASGSTYTIVAGDTIGKIAARFGVPTASLLSANGLGWSSIIYAGRTLTVPGGAAPVAVAPVAAPAVSVTPAPTAPVASGDIYTIVSGDTIGTIASKFGVSTASLLSANGLVASSIIYAGRSLTIPGTTTAGVVATPIAPTVVPVVSITPAPRVGNTAHVIKSGETIGSIARTYGVTVQRLLDANSLGWSSIIYSGRSLVIPGVDVATPPAPGVTPLTSTMAANARTIIGVGKSLGVSDRGLVIALATAMQESSLENLNYGDRDSLGLFQQRPSTGWGSPAQVTDPVYAAKLFFGGPSNPNTGITRGLLDIPDWQSKTLTQAAQAVQISAYPDAYAKWETSALAWLDQLT